MLSSTSSDHVSDNEQSLSKENARRASRVFDVESVRQDFPILSRLVHGKPLVYLDNAATTQKPKVVIDALVDYYTSYNANVHRGAHFLATEATEAFEQARTTVANFINTAKPGELIWTKGCTEGLNLIAYGWGDLFISPGDIILVSELEHHANIVPWQLLAKRRDARVLPIALNDEGVIDLAALDKLIVLHGKSIKAISISHVSNALGSINPVDKIVERAKSIDAISIVDGAQAVAHLDVDVQALGCDFYLFSGHKLFGPTGTGALYGREEILDRMQPFQAGGEMIEQVSFSGTTFNTLPFKFEAGTPHIEGVIGFGKAVEYFSQFDHQAREQYESELLQYLISESTRIEGVRQIGPSDNNAGVFSFLLEGCHPSDVGMLLDEQGIAIRTGHHCAQPLMSYLDVPGTARASLAFYNNRDDVDRFVSALKQAKSLFA